MTNFDNTINLQLLELYVVFIIGYDGNPHTLNIFVNSVDNLATLFTSTDCFFENYLERAILGKLGDRALTLIGARNELKTCNAIKECLLLSFGDQRNLECLVRDLLNLRR